jgi:hypothetical protein
MKRKSLHKGKSLVDRLYERQRKGIQNSRGQDGSSSMGGLYSQNMPNGEVFRGSLADQALKSVGARALTIDDQIIVNHNFSSGKVEDQALYAHERFHQEQSGGAAGASINDAEEKAAQAIEMIVHQKAESGDLDAIPQSPTELLEEAKEKGMLDAPSKSSGSNTATPKQENDDTESNSTNESDAVSAYLNMLEDGMTHEDIVLYIVHKVRSQLREKESSSMDRSGDYRSFLH